MRTKLVSVAVAAALAGACSSASSDVSKRAATSPSPAAHPRSHAFLPDPDRRVPATAPRLAAEIERVNRALRASIDEWLENGRPSTRLVPEPVVLQALYQQRLYRAMSEDIDVARRVAKRIGGAIGRAALRNARAAHGLRTLVTPVKPTQLFDTQRPEPPGVLLRYYRKAQARFGVDWEVLAAINYIETRFGRIKSSSSAGAQGPMQFIPATWEAYGMGGDVHDPRDAIMGAANYLRASGAPADYEDAIWHYNHDWDYVAAVLIYAREMMRDPRNYYAYYNHQVFMATTKGDVQLTGPGADV